MQLTPANYWKWYLFAMPFPDVTYSGYDEYSFKGLDRAVFVPKNSPVMTFLPASSSGFSATLIKTGDYRTNKVLYTLDINATNRIFNATTLYLQRVIDGVGYRYYYNNFYVPAEEIYQKSVSSIFNTKTVPLTSDDFLTYQTEELGDSLATFTVQLLSGWAYNDTTYSCRAVHYLLKITKGGGLNTAQFVWTKVPYSVGTSYYKPDKTSFYSEALPYYQYSSTTIRAYAYSIQQGSFFYLASDGIWCESRRKDPTQKDYYIFLVVRSNKRSIEVFETPWEFEPEKIFSYTADFDVKQATWFNGRIILLEDSDPYTLHVLDLDSTITQIAETSIPQGSTVMLVSHPDQDVCYLLGETEQWILQTDLTTETTTFDLTGLISWDHIQFDIDGYVWFDGSKRDKNLLTEVLNVPNARCNYTYIAVDNGDDTYSAYHLDGTTEIRNIAEEAKSQLFWSGVAYRYPQKILYPYNATDLQLFTDNGDLTSPNWYGWDGSQWVAYDGNNPRTVDSTTIELEDGVQLTFDFSQGDFVQDEYFYFTVAEGIIKDALSELEIKKVYDLRFWEYHYIDITVATPTVVDNGDGTYTYTIPEAANANFWELDTFLMQATFDDPEQNGSGVDAEIITSGTPTSGQVLIDSDAGTVTFAEADIGRTFQMHYYVIIDIDCPF